MMTFRETDSGDACKCSECQDTTEAGKEMPVSRGFVSLPEALGLVRPTGDNPARYWPAKPGPIDTPRVSLQEAQAIVETQTAPRVTEAGIKDRIANRAFYFYHHLTICILTLGNGFFVVGKAAPADPANFDKAVGERYAFEDAFRQIWQLEGYALRDRLARNEG